MDSLQTVSINTVMCVTLESCAGFSGAVSAEEQASRLDVGARGGRLVFDSELTQFSEFLSGESEQMCQSSRRQTAGLRRSSTHRRSRDGDIVSVRRRVQLYEGDSIR